MISATHMAYIYASLIVHKAKLLLIASRAPRVMHFRHDTVKYTRVYMCICVFGCISRLCTCKCVIKAKRTKGTDATMESRAPMEKV